MIKGEKHYIIFSNDNKISLVNSLTGVNRLDIIFIIERTFIKQSSGLHLFSYFDNKILDSNLNYNKENCFLWGNIKCKLKEYDFYGYYQYYLSDSKIQSSCFEIEVEDLLNNKCKLQFNSAFYDSVNKEYIFKSTVPFYNLINDINLLNRVGTCVALYEIKKLEDKIEKIQLKLNTISKKQ